VFDALSAKQQTTFKRADVISALPVLQGGAEALIRRPGKLYGLLSAFFLGNIRAKNY